MRTIFSILMLFSLCGATAQQYTPSYGRELPRSEVIAFPTQEAASQRGENRFLTHITTWTPAANTFSTPFTVPFAWANRQVLLHLDAASSDYEVRINGKAVAYNANANAPADFNITRYTKEGRNTLDIILTTPATGAVLESWKESPKPSLGAAWIFSQPTLRVRDVLIKTWRSDNSDSRDTTARAEVDIVVKSNALNPRTSRISYELLAPTGEMVAHGAQEMTLDMRREDTLRFLANIPMCQLWSTEQPTLYTLRIKTQHEGRNVEFLEFRPGFRTFEMRQGQPIINGQPVTLRVRKITAGITDDEIITLRQQGYNALMLQSGITPPTLYDICDTQGLYLIVQAPIDTRRSGLSRRKGGNPTNDPAWLGAYLERTADSYHTTKFHPSVIAFSLAEKSANGINLYESYLNLKRFKDARPFIYLDAGGEWNNDPLKL